jgi:hydrogenase maturation factor
VSPGAEAITLIQGADSDAPACGSQHCITCGDDGVPMSVVALDPERGLALCAGESGRSSVETALVEPVEVGDRLLVHAGTAIARLEAL